MYSERKKFVENKVSKLFSKEITFLFLNECLLLMIDLKKQFLLKKKKKK